MLPTKSPPRSDAQKAPQSSTRCDLLETLFPPHQPSVRTPFNLCWNHEESTKRASRETAPKGTHQLKTTASPFSDVPLLRAPRSVANNAGRAFPVLSTEEVPGYSQIPN